jgi:hypothetical protein
LFVNTQNPITAKRQAQDRRSKRQQAQDVKQAGEMEPKKPGRKPGKHSDESYTQTSIYLPIELRNRVRSKLYEQGMEMSGLIESMLRDWLSKQ